MGEIDEAVRTDRRSQPADASFDAQLYAGDEMFADIPADRMRGLLGATLDVARAVDLDEVLQHVVVAARNLVHARYGALAVLQQGRLVRFVHTGMDADTVTSIGQWPEGKGVLGRLIDYPEPLRLADLTRHLASSGFPDQHPPMHTFLGVPIHVGERVYGNVYLTEKIGGAEFTDDDQRVVRSLAAAAAVAIDNAALFAEARRRHAWQAAMVEVTTSLLTGSDPEEALRQLVHQARIAAGANGAGVAVLTEDPSQVRVSYAEGTYARWQDQRAALTGSVAGAALSAGQAVLIADPDSDPRMADLSSQIPGVLGETLAVPIFADGQPIGVLVVSRARQDESFDHADLELISTYAAQVGLALRLADVRRDTEQRHLVEDRQHIAEDLRQRVIRRLFGLGLALQGTIPRVANDTAANTLTAGIEELDAIIRDIRAAVFSLNHAE